MRRSGGLQYGMEAASMLASSLPLSLSPAMAERGTLESSEARLRASCASLVSMDHRPGQNTSRGTGPKFLRPRTQGMLTKREGIDSVSSVT